MIEYWKIISLLALLWTLWRVIDYVTSLFKSDPDKKFLKERDRLYSKAVELQRNGDLRGYAEVMSQIEQLEMDNEE
jgi:hypothetical protein